MGREARCAVSHDGQQAEAKALLETDELIVRSPFRLTVPRAGDPAATAAEGDLLTVRLRRRARSSFELGEREAAKWAADIANPKTLADKLGVKPGQRVRLVGGAGWGAGGRRARWSTRARRTSCSWRPRRPPTSSRSPRSATRSRATARSG